MIILMKLHQNLCLNYYSRNLVYSTLVVITPESANEFLLISIWRLVKPHANYCVDILKARWLRPTFAESSRLLRVNQAKELVVVHVWNAPDQWQNWRVAGVRTSPLTKLNVKTKSLPSLRFGIYYFFGFSRSLFFCVFHQVHKHY